MKCKIYNNAKYEGLDNLAKDLHNFAHERFGFTKPTMIVFESNIENAKKMFASTGHYNPQSNKIVIYTDHRHPKDILRSLAHELVHHKQNCDGYFDGMGSTDPGYAQRDQHMREMEGDAYRTGNIMLFRDWADNYEKRNRTMYESQEKVDIAEPKDKLVKANVSNIEKEEKLEAQKTPVNTWYNNKLYNSLMKKFIKS